MNLFKKIFPYFAAPFLALIIFCLVFEIWKIDLTVPSFGYDADAVFSLFCIKNIVDTGWIFTNSYVGLPHLTEVFSTYDFPIQSDLFDLVVFKIFSYFTSNAALIANLFFILSFALIAATSFIVLRVFKISIFTATIISVIYAFLPYHMMRGVWHLFLSNYMIAPFSVMVALWISSDKLGIFGVNDKQQYCIKWNKFFFISAAIAIFAAMSGVYYAYYSCIIFIFAWFLRAFKKGSFLNKGTTEPILLCVITLQTLVVLFLPTLLYQIQNGYNSMVGGRDAIQSEHYALRVIDLLMPLSGHHIEALSNLRNNFNLLVDASAERVSATLGFTGAIGFIFLLMWLIGKAISAENSFLEKTIKRFSLTKNDQNLISDLAIFNLLSVLFASVGGLVMFISMSFPLIRSHARFCIFIAFFALFLIAIISDKIIERKICGKKIYAQIALFILMILAVYDQTGRGLVSYVQNHIGLEKYQSDHEFVAKIENSMPPQAMIFMLPFSKFPEFDVYQQLVAYINSKQLRWSYPSIAGRESSKWQQQVVTLEFKKFIAAIKKAGFAGIYIDRPQYRDKYSLAKLGEIEKLLKSYSKSPMLISKNKQLVFFKI